MRRREFIGLVGGAAALWPLAVRVQERVRRVGILVAGPGIDDPDVQARYAAFVQAMRQLGWTDGRNLRIDLRAGLGDPVNIRKYAAELVALAPDVIIGQFAVIQAVAPSAGVEVSAINLRDAGEIERAVTAFARPGNGGLIVTSSALSVVHRDLIIALAARHKLPAVYYRRNFVDSGGLIFYGQITSTSFAKHPGISMGGHHA